MTNVKQTILIVSTDVALTQRIQCLLRENGYDTAVSSNIVTDVRRHVPALILIAGNRISNRQIKQMRQIGSMPIVLFREPNSRCAEDDCIEELNVGADAAICNATYRELIARIRAILWRDRHQSRRQATYVAGPLRMDLDRHEVTVEEAGVELTMKEFTLLQMFLESPNRVLSREELLNRVWGEDYALDEHSLDVHIHNLRRKIESAGTSSLIMTVRGIGYKLNMPQS